MNASSNARCFSTTRARLYSCIRNVGRGSEFERNGRAIMALSLRCSLFLDGGHFAGGGLCHELQRLSWPVLALDPAAELQVVIDQRDFLVREVGELLELDDVDIGQALLVGGQSPL